MEKGITIPHSSKLEKQVLSAMIVDDKGHLDAMPVLKLPEMFYEQKHQLIFKAIQELSFKNQPIDLMTVNQKLTEMGTLEKVGGAYELVNLSNLSGSAAHIEEHCRYIVQYWVKRMLISNADKIKQMAFSQESDSLELLEQCARLNDELNEILYHGSKEKSYAAALRSVVKRVEFLSTKKEGEFTGVPTGFDKVNKFTGGWQPSDLIIVAARPGMGKTALILKNLVECGLQGIPAGMFSLEMSIEQLAARTVGINSNFHLTQLIRDGFEKPEYFPTLLEREKEMSSFPLYIDDTANQDIRDIISKARIWKRKYDIQILFVDYIQLATDKTKGNNREQEIASISRGLKMLAKELNIPVIALSQLSRQVETRNDKRPKLSDLRESGAIEQDADIVTFLYRPEYYGEELPHEMEPFCNAEFSFGKYRAGSLGTIDLFFQGDKAKYSDYSPEKKRSENNFDDVPFNIPQGDPNTVFDQD